MQQYSKTLPTTVYHGTTSNHIPSLILGIDLTKCRPQTDFGQGFYLTQNFNQAKRWATRHRDTTNNSEKTKYLINRNYKTMLVDAVVIKYTLDIQSILTFPGYIFDTDDDNWRYFVYTNRNEGYLVCKVRDNREGRYHFVYGPLADGIMGDIRLVNDGLILFEDFVRTIISIGNQISFHSKLILPYVILKEVIYV